MSRIRLLSTASFRLAALYLALFTASALALGAFVYFSVRHEILTDFDERIAEEFGRAEERVRRWRTRQTRRHHRRAGIKRRRLRLRFRSFRRQVDRRRFAPPAVRHRRQRMDRSAGDRWRRAARVKAGGHTFAHHAARRRVVPPRRRRAPPLGYDPDRRAGSLRLGGRGHARHGDDRRIVAERAVPGPYRLDAANRPPPHGRRLEPANSAKSHRRRLDGARTDLQPAVRWN